MKAQLNATILIQQHMLAKENMLLIFIHLLQAIKLNVNAQLNVKNQVIHILFPMLNFQQEITIQMI